MEKDIEIWKDIKDFEGLYQVSTWGRVKSLNYHRTGREGILKPGKQNGYLVVRLTRKVKKYVHYLVAKAFIHNPENKQCIDHIDGNRLNNSVDNLCWCTYIENNNNPITRERMSNGHKKSEKCKNFYETIKKQVVCLKDNKVIKIYNGIHDVLKDGFNDSHVCSCCKGKRKSHAGYNWKYMSNEKMFGQLN